MYILYNTLFFIISYLIGSIPSGLIIGKLFKNIDIRNHGSGNLGGTNAVRVLGKQLGSFVGAMDVLKGGAVILLANHLFPIIFDSSIPAIIFGITAVIGHVFPIFAKFRGGKAVATSGGVILFTSPPIFIIGIITFIITILLSKYVSLASTAVAIVIFIISIIAHIFSDNPFFKPFNSDISLIITIFVLMTFVIWRHIPNYKRLINGNERKVGQKYK